MTIKTISIAPTWSGLYPLLKQFIMTGTTEQKRYVCIELEKLCELADKVNKQNEQEGE